MKSLVKYLDEKLVINKNSNIVGITHKYHPKTREELIEILSKLCNYDNEIYMKNCVLDVSDIDVSKIDDFSNIFAAIDNASYIRMEKLIISGWNTSSATNMSQMFGGLIEVKEIVGIDELDVSGVTDMSWMFAQCNSLKKIDLSKWTIKKCKNFSYMFYGCKSLLDVSFVKKWTLNDVENINSMFKECRKIKSADITGLAINKPLSLSGLYENCTRLIDVGDISKINYTNVYSFNSMFKGCRNIEHIGNIEGWKIDHYIDTTEMFKGCKKLKDIPSWWLY